MEKIISDNIPMLLALEGKEAVTRTADTAEFFKLLKQEFLAKVDKFMKDTDNEAKLKSLADIVIMLEQFEKQADAYLEKKGTLFSTYIDERRIYVGDYERRLVLTGIRKMPEKSVEDKKKELLDYGGKYDWPAIILAGTKEKPLKILGPGRDKWDNAMSWFDVSKDNVDEWLSAVRRDARL